MLRGVVLGGVLGLILGGLALVAASLSAPQPAGNAPPVPPSIAAPEAVASDTSEGQAPADLATLPAPGTPSAPESLPRAAPEAAPDEVAEAAEAAPIAPPQTSNIPAALQTGGLGADSAPGAVADVEPVMPSLQSLPPRAPTGETDMVLSTRTAPPPAPVEVDPSAGPAIVAVAPDGGAEHVVAEGEAAAGVAISVAPQIGAPERGNDLPAIGAPAERPMPASPPAAEPAPVPGAAAVLPGADSAPVQTRTATALAPTTLPEARPGPAPALPEADAPRVAAAPVLPEAEAPPVAAVSIQPEAEAPRVATIPGLPDAEAPPVAAVPVQPEAEAPPVAAAPVLPEAEAPPVAVVPVQPEAEAPPVAVVPVQPEAEAPPVAATPLQALPADEPAAAGLPGSRNTVFAPGGGRLQTLGSQMPGGTAPVRVNRAGVTQQVAPIDPDAPVLTGRALTDFAADYTASGLPLMAVLLYDDGSLPIEAVEGVPLPLTILLDPAADLAPQTARAWVEAGYEVAAIARLPQGARPRDAEVALEAVFAALPQAIALVDTGGFGLTGQDLSEQVMGRLAEDGRGFVTISPGLGGGLQVAEAEAVPAAAIYRDLDGEDQEARVIRRFLDQAAFRARQQSGVVLLARLRPDTLSALTLWADANRASQVDVAPLSAVLNAQVEG